MSINIDQWLSEAKAEANASGCGMYLIHNGVVRESSKNTARNGIEEAPVIGMKLSCDHEKLDEVIAEALKMPGIECVRVFINEGELKVGDDIMYLLVGGDIRPNVISCLEYTLGRIKGEVLEEVEKWN